MKLYIVGFGPGGLEYMTNEAVSVIKEADIIVGYSTYVEIVKEYFPEKKYFQTPMKKEIDRCRWAIEETLKGSNVALVCSGDSGIYGLAGLIYELTKDYPPFEIEVVAGVTAACSGGSVLGAPLTHDFAVISLSDLLTPWEVIEERVKMASKADFVVCLYNPSSKKRHDYLQKACDMMMEYKKKDTVCGYVRNIGRMGEEYHICTLEELREVQVDMFTTVFVGNSNTKNINNKMVTPRGYHI
ncbi:MAG: precorrin-3B C(17)-methyltransferase [bacterium]|nr:precorrin-3B C(17)-methyltransferase [bacterium]